MILKIRQAIKAKNLKNSKILDLGILSIKRQEEKIFPHHKYDARIKRFYRIKRGSKAPPPSLSLSETPCK